MRYNHFVKDFWRNGRKLLLTIGCLLALVLGWQGSLITPNNSAHATPLVGNSYLFADLESSDLGDQIKERAQQTIDKGQNAIDNVGQKMERAADRKTGVVDPDVEQTKERAQQNVKDIQDAADKASNPVENAAENALESVKNFFKP